MKAFRIVGRAFLVSALACAIGLGWNLRPNKYEGLIQTTGTVVEHTHHRTYDRDDRHWNDSWAVVVRFSDETGAEREVESLSRTSNPEPIGAQVDVRYPPGQPDRVQVGMDSFFWVLFLGIWTSVLTVLGIAFTVAGRVTRKVPTADRKRGFTGEDKSEPTFSEPPLDEFRPDADPPEGGWPRRS